MASSNRQLIYGQPTTAITQSHYFLITMTNYPNALLRTQQYHEPPIQVICNDHFRPMHSFICRKSFQTRNLKLDIYVLFVLFQQYIQQYRGAIFIPNTPMRIGIDGSERYERFLYTTLRFELEESVRAYLQQTQRLYPINLVFDLSHISQQRSFVQ